MSVNSVADAEDVNGHGDHAGPVFPAEGPDGKWGDIIPPFTYGAFSYPGMNWDTAGQAIFNNGCNIPPPTKKNVNVSTVVFDDATDKALVDLKLAAGGSVYDTSRVVPPSAIPAPTGTISYTFYKNGGCTGPGTDAGSLLALGSNSNLEASLTAGPYSFKASYSGDSHYNGNTSACEPFTVTAAPPPEKKVTICHADSNSKQPYGPKPIEVSINSVGDAEDVNGHGTHTGPVFPGEKWGDIIPPFTYGAFSYPGMNWTTEGQAIWDKGCSIESAKDPTAVTTQSSTTSNDVEAVTSVTDTATVTNTTGSATPTGSVQFKISFNGETTIVGATKTLDGTGHATSDAFNVTADTPYGEYCWQAFFTATGNFENSSETDKTNECFEVSGPYDPRTTTTTVVFNAATNAALVGNLPVNGSVYDTSTVKHLGGGTPTGTIAYTFYTNFSCSGDGTSAGSGLALGTKSSTMGPLAAGQYSFKASYTSNTEDFNSSTSDCEPFTVSPAQLTPTPSPSGGVLAATGATPPTQDLAIFLIALGLVVMMGGAFAWRRREA